jgi:hypothetical protein
MEFSQSIKTLAFGSRGFDVHERELGRSSLALDYRIVDRPLDIAAGHLPSVATLTHVKSALTQARDPQAC